MKRTVLVVASVLLLVLLASALLAVGAVVGIATATGPAEDAWVASPMRGQLVDAEGAPRAGVPIERRWHSRGDRGVQQAVTDADGRFELPGVHPPASLARWLPGEDVNVQFLLALPPEGEVELMQISTNGSALLAETGGAPFDVVCRTGVEPLDDAFHWGRCTVAE